AGAVARRACLSGGTAGGDLSLYACARTAHRLAPCEPAGGTRIPLARRRRPARSGPHHRARQHRQSRSRARAQTPSHSPRRQREPDLRLARRARAAADRHSLRAAREGIPLSYRTLGALIGRPEQVEALARNAEDTMKTIMQRVGTIPPSRRPRVYYARGP